MAACRLDAALLDQLVASLQRVLGMPVTVGQAQPQQHSSLGGSAANSVSGTTMRKSDSLGSNLSSHCLSDVGGAGNATPVAAAALLRQHPSGLSEHSAAAATDAAAALAAAPRHQRQGSGAGALVGTGAYQHRRGGSMQASDLLDAHAAASGPGSANHFGPAVPGGGTERADSYPSIPATPVGAVSPTGSLAGLQAHQQHQQAMAAAEAAAAAQQQPGGEGAPGVLQRQVSGPGRGRAPSPPPPGRPSRLPTAPPAEASPLQRNSAPLCGGDAPGSPLATGASPGAAQQQLGTPASTPPPQQQEEQRKGCAVVGPPRAAVLDGLRSMPSMLVREEEKQELAAGHRPVESIMATPVRAAARLLLSSAPWAARHARAD